MNAHRLALRSGEDLHVGGRRNGGQRLAAEAEGMEVGEVAKGSDFARRVALEGELQVFRGDAVAVVGDADEGDTALLDFDADAAGAGVNGVIE